MEVGSSGESYLSRLEFKVCEWLKCAETDGSCLLWYVVIYYIS